VEAIPYSPTAWLLESLMDAQTPQRVFGLSSDPLVLFLVVFVLASFCDDALSVRGRGPGGDFPFQGPAPFSSVLFLAAFHSASPYADPERCTGSRT